ncbi:MAG: DUF3108 domain-containing protein [Planctomycetes bacterium]|nr:DUF3108 domain-containing protein [Planctomycetota bacterium]
MPRRPDARPFLLVVFALAACGPENEPGSAARESTVAESSNGPRAGSAAVVPNPDATEPGAVLSDQWYAVREDGRKNGWYHMVWTRSTFEGKPSIHDHTTQFSSSTRVMAGMEDVFESESDTHLERTNDGRLLSLRSKTTQGDRVETTETVREGASYVWVYKVAGREERRTVAVPGLVPVDAEAFLAPIIRSGELQQGATFTFRSPNYLASRLETVNLWVRGQEDVTTPAGPARCWRITQTVTGRPGESTWWLDEQGVLTRLSEPPVSIERTTEDKAKLLDPEGAPYSITMPAEPNLPRCTSLDACTVDVAIEARADVPLPDFPATPFSKEISREGPVIHMRLTAHDDPAATTALPVDATADAALARALEANNLYAPDSPAVRSALKDATKNLSDAERADARAVARAVLRWVFKTLRKESGPIPQPTAPEIIDAGMGDCSEHAVLFVALCRAAQIPARRLSGYAQVGDMWGAHSFCEVWLGKWIGADPTTNELGTRARYVAFGWDEDPDSYPGLVSQRVTGHMNISTTSITDDGVTIPIEDVRRRKPLRDDTSGLVFADPPEGWKVRIRSAPGVAEITGPGVSVSVHVSSGVGDLDVDLLRETQFAGGTRTKFSGHPAVRAAGGFLGRGATTWAVPWRRRTLLVVARIQGSEADNLAVLAKLLAPTLGPPPAEEPKLK